MKFKAFYTLGEQAQLKADEKWDDVCEEKHIETVTVAVKKRLDTIKRKIEAAKEKSSHRKARSTEPLLSLVDSVRFIAAYARNKHPARTTSSYLISNGCLDIGAGSLCDLLDLAANAIIENDPSFFVRIGKALEIVVHSTKEEQLVHCAHSALFNFQQDGVLFPTKLQVKELAVREHAIKLYVARKNAPALITLVDADGKRGFTAKAISEIQREEKLIVRGTNWAYFWKRAGLDELDGDKGGRPPKEKTNPPKIYRWREPVRLIVPPSGEES